ncbi:MAG: phosphate ABC transporter, permease protein PstA [Thermoplasmata archaeon M9B2D]|nr:MAG: phosphate ABC transporter, permease protein PstA [Thermoplasmata archaeon M9B2D]
MEHLNSRTFEEQFFKILMILSVCIVVGSLLIIFSLVMYHGVSSLSLEMITQTPDPSDALGGGILNAIVGSLLLALPATGLACFISLGIALYLQREFTPGWMSGFIRFTLDVLWGIPSIVYGIFCLMIMIYLGMGSSLVVGIIALTLLQIPIITRYMDEAIKMVPMGLKEGAYSLGSTKFETAYKVIRRQAFPGILAGILLGLGRGIGDAASILFTAGFSNRIPTSLFDSTAALPTMIFNLYSLPSGQPKAFASAFILLLIVLVISILSRLLSKRFTKHIIP